MGVRACRSEPIWATDPGPAVDHTAETASCGAPTIVTWGSPHVAHLGALARARRRTPRRWRRSSGWSSRHCPAGSSPPPICSRALVDDDEPIACPSLLVGPKRLNDVDRRRHRESLPETPANTRDPHPETSARMRLQPSLMCLLMCDRSCKFMNPDGVIHNGALRLPCVYG